MTRWDCGATGIALAALGFLLLASCSNGQQLAERNRCMQKQRVLAEANLRYAMQQGHFPGYVNRVDDHADSVSWTVALFPLIDRQELYDNYISGDEDAPQYVPQLVCPAHQPNNKSDSFCGYVANAGQPDSIATSEVPADWAANGVFHNRLANNPDGTLVQTTSVTVDYITENDGRANTLLITENLDAGLWVGDAEWETSVIWQPRISANGIPHESIMAPLNQDAFTGNPSYRFARPSSLHGHGFVAAFCDGQTRFIHEGIDYIAYCDMLSPHGQQAQIAGREELVPATFRQLELAEK